MTNDAKESVMKALMKHHANELKKATKKSRTNRKPEKEFEKVFLAHAREQGFNLDVIEAKGGYRGDFDVIPVKSGFSDLVGCDPFGRACYIELKAPGKRKTLRANQYKFLEDKIKFKCFAACVDSIDYFDYIYDVWRNEDTMGRKILFLMKELPVPKQIVDDGKPLFDE